MKPFSAKLPPVVMLPWRKPRRLDDFIRLFNDLRGGRGPSLSVVAEGGKPAADAIGGDFILEKQRR